MSRIPRPTVRVGVSLADVRPTSHQDALGGASSGHAPARLGVPPRSQDDLSVVDVLAPADWMAWLRRSSTPPVSDVSESQRVLRVGGGVILDPASWPLERVPRVYVVYGDDGALYVGQTRRRLAERIRAHFGSQRTLGQQVKAGQWRFIVTASFNDLDADELDALETHAAQWLLPLHQRRGRRHPRQH